MPKILIIKKNPETYEITEKDLTVKDTLKFKTCSWWRVCYEARISH